MAPVDVEAELAAGLSFSVPWGIGLDGLLASALWHRTRDPLRTERALEGNTVADLELPLARCELAADEQGDVWHWMATCCRLEGVHGAVETHHTTAHLDQRALEQATFALPNHLDPVRGRWRRRRIPHLVTIAATARWRAVGDIDAIRDLLEDIESIGKRRAAGEGQVLAWHVRPLPDVDPLEAGHLHGDRRLGRPSPQQCVEALGLSEPGATGGRGIAAIRPPAMHPCRMAPLVLPAHA